MGFLVPGQLQIEFPQAGIGRLLRRRQIGALGPLLLPEVLPQGGQEGLNRLASAP